MGVDIIARGLASKKYNPVSDFHYFGYDYDEEEYTYDTSFENLLNTNTEDFLKITKNSMYLEDDNDVTVDFLTGAVKLWNAIPTQLYFISDHAGQDVPVGTLITLTAVVNGVPEDIEYELKWQYTPDGGQTIVDAGTGATYQYTATLENIDWLWRIVIEFEEEDVNHEIVFNFKDWNLYYTKLYGLTEEDPFGGEE